MKTGKNQGCLHSRKCPLEWKQPCWSGNNPSGVETIPLRVRRAGGWTDGKAHTGGRGKREEGADDSAMILILGCSVKIDKASRLRTRVNFSRTRNSYADTERIRHTPRPPWRQGP